ncbi:SRR1-like protein [Zophobas morio]|uniref:SRR1-like protein n=1 Tax=Zophobas morio TaxID=2755281 RepID=UPI0030837A03
MSNKSHGSNDDFKLITYKREKKSTKSPIQTNKACADTNLPPRDAIVRRIEDAKLEVKSSDLLASALASLREGTEILSQSVVTEIICFGLGRVGESMISRFQFAFLLCLKDFYNVGVKVYDPVFTEVDCWLLEQFGCFVIKENFGAKFRVTDKCTRIFYLPHCPRQLTNNLLWANWGLNLHYCVIVANSFNTIVDITPNRDLNKSAEYIVKIVPHMVELALINSFRLYEIFNDTAIHVFPWTKLKLLSDDFWSLHPEPKYSKDDVELITNEVDLITDA